jgi:hypothetical protein
LGDADEQRVKTVRPLWTKLTPRGQAECNQVRTRKFQVEMKRRYAKMTPPEIEAEEELRRGL